MAAQLQRPDDLRLERDARGVLTLTFNRPELRNAMDEVFMADLITLLESLREEDARALVLTGEGKAFCAGADIRRMKAAGAESFDDNLSDARAIAKLMHTLDTLPMPTIAKVNGAAMGGGVGIVACCDMAIAADVARFSFSEVKLGIIPGAISPYSIRAIGPRNARRYFQTGERFDAATAEKIGLVHEVVALDELDNAVEALLGEMLAGGPRSIRAAKELIFAIAGKPIDESIREESAQRIARQRATDEAAEGLTAFLEKRKASWVP